MTKTESKRIARSIKAYPVNSNLPFSTYEKTAAHLQMQIAIYRDESNWKQVYRLGLALISLVQETMKKHAEWREKEKRFERWTNCLLYTSPSPRDKRQSRMPSSA